MLNVDDILQMCQGIAFAREMKEFYREEKLYRNLIRIMRSPETLLKLTRRRDQRKIKSQ